MNLHLDKENFKDAVKITSQRLDIPDIYIEKDYWVTYVLYTIFHNEIGKETIFKGGTALSKCFRLIDRFSEDIDLVVMRKEGEANNQLTNKIKQIGKIVARTLPEIEIGGITNKKGRNRKTAYSYGKMFEGNFGQVKDVIIVEATWLGSSEPFIKSSISSLIYEMMLNTGQEKIAGKYNLLPFELNVLDPKRTLCEKIMSLVRFSYTEHFIEELKNKVRHMYDLHQLFLNDELMTFFQSESFNEMLIRVATDDVESFKNNNRWLRYHPNKAKIFAELETVWEELKPTYSGGFKDLVFGNFPEEKKILDSLKSIRKRLKSVDWTITT